MEINEIVTLMQAMHESGIDQLELAVGASKLKLKRHPQAAVADVAADRSEHASMAPLADTAAVVPVVQAEVNDARDPVEEKPGQLVTAPVVGVFFAAASPESAPFAEMGKDVKSGDIVCIIEAMKLMNEVSSTASGKVLEIYAKNGQKVQYGDPLFRIG